MSKLDNSAKPSGSGFSATGKFITRLLMTGFLTTFLFSCATDLDSTDLLLQASNTQDVEALKKKTDSSTTEPLKVEHGIFTGVVTELLPDDLKGLKHQHFMLKVSGMKYNGLLIKIAHDIDYAPRVPVKTGSQLEIKGDLITNAQPMVLHWTHRAYNNSPHPHGYIKFNGEVYH